MGTAIIFIIALLIAWQAWVIRKYWRSRKAESANTRQLQDEQAKYYNIEPLDGFDWRVTKPLQFRPYKPKFHMTMALENITLSDLLAVDSTYLQRITLRRELISREGNAVVAANAVIVPAIQEMYTWLMGTYLPRRFPTMFHVENATEKRGLAVRNLVTDELLPVEAPTSGEECLRTIGSHVDDEFLFLLPSSNPLDEAKYRLEGYVNCFPSGFDTREKLGKKLADIHAPVPGYAAKLEKSMDRYFAALPVGKIIRRVNWSVTTTDELFVLSGNHYHEGDEEKAERGEEVDVKKAMLRCERQTLHRLPHSRAIVFAFKTYMYPISQVKEEGGGEALADAIDGVYTGSIPEMAFYKRAVVWGEPVKKYLRS